MKYTAGELRKMNGRKCKFQYRDKPEAEGEIYVVNGKVDFVTNEKKYDGYGSIKEGYQYSWILFSHHYEDNYTYDYQITFIDEQKTSPEKHQNIYYDDNGEEIREGDWVLVCGGKFKRIFLCKIPRCRDKYFCVNEEEAELYNTDKEYLGVSSRSTCIKYKDEKKLRELRMTDEEYEEFKNKYK